MPPEAVAAAAEGTQETAWYSSLPDEFTLEQGGQQVKAKDHPFVKETPDLPSFIRNAFHMKQATGGGLTKLPAKEKAEEVTKWKSENFPKLAAAGLLSLPPEKPEGYEIKAPEKLPDGITWNNDLATKAAGLFHKHGLSKEAAGELVALQVEAMTDSVNGMQKSIALTKEQGMARLRSSDGWKTEEEFKTNAELAGRFGAALFAQDPEMEKFFSDTGLGNHPLWLRAAALAGRNMQEDDGFLKSVGAAGVEEVKAEILKMRTDPTHPQHAAWIKEGHANHLEAMSYMEGLLKKAYGTAEVS